MPSRRLMIPFRVSRSIDGWFCQCWGPLIFLLLFNICLFRIKHVVYICLTFLMYLYHIFIMFIIKLIDGWFLPKLRPCLAIGGVEKSNSFCFWCSWKFQLERFLYWYHTVLYQRLSQTRVEKLNFFCCSWKVSFPISKGATALLLLKFWKYFVCLCVGGCWWHCVPVGYLACFMFLIKGVVGIKSQNVDRCHSPTNSQEWSTLFWNHTSIKTQTLQCLVMSSFFNNDILTV